MLLLFIKLLTQALIPWSFALMDEVSLIFALCLIHPEHCHKEQSSVKGSDNIKSTCFLLTYGCVYNIHGKLDEYAMHP